MRIAITATAGRARVELTTGELRPYVLAANATGARVAFVATHALLLAGDHIQINVRVGRGAWLDVVETAGTVAYAAKGIPASWTTSITLAEEAELRWFGEPFVVAHGANVTRDTTVELAAGSVATFRDTLVLGRHGEVGGALVARSHVRVDGRDLLVETLDLRMAAQRAAPGMLGTARVIDTVAWFGAYAPPADAPPGATRCDLASAGTVIRHLGRDLAGSPLAMPGVSRSLSVPG